MATIREDLVIGGNFAQVFSSYLNLGRQIAANMQVVTGTQNDFTEAVAQSEKALEEMAGVGSRAADSMEDTSNAARRMADASRGASNGQDRLNRSMRSGATAADGLTRKIMGLATAYLGLRSAQQLISLSDTWTQTTARLDRMNDGTQTKTELQDAIFQVAQRSRGDYQDTADMVAKLGTLAPEAFNNNTEVLAFVEQINKHIKLSGASAQGAQAAILQLTQAMSSGVLRGEELNSVLEQTPTIANAIAEYLGVSIGRMRELASQGDITTNVVKAALFTMADDVNEAVEDIPLTFSDAMTTVKREGLNALRPVLEELNTFLNSNIGRDALNGFIAAVRMGGEVLLWLLQLVESGAAFIQEHWGTVSTLLIAGAIAVAAVMTYSAINSAIAWATMNPVLLLIVGSIVLVIYMARQMGATWEDVCGIVGGLLYGLHAFAHNLVAVAWNNLAIFGEFFANFLIDPKTAVIHLMADLADRSLGYLQAVARGIDTVFGSNLADAVSGWRSDVQNWADSFGENKIKIQRMEMIDYTEAWRQGSSLGRGVGSALDNFNISDYLSGIGGQGFNYEDLLAASGINSTLSDIGADTKAIRNSVSLSEEDIKLLVDMATREYVNNINLTAQTPIINVTGQNTGDTELDRRALADAIKDILLEESASSTALAYT